MARLSSVNYRESPPDLASINLTRMLARLQHALENPDSETEARLRTSASERDKLGVNLNHAQSLLLGLEEDAIGIKLQSRKQDTQADLSRKREHLERLSERLQELNELASYEADEDETEDEDIIAEDTPSEETDASQADLASETPSPTNPTPPPIPAPPVFKASIPDPVQEPQSTLRARNKDARGELLGSAGSSTGISTATAEAILTHNRTEQENLTSSLLKMASALKESSNAFGKSLEDEKDILDSATQGLDKNELGLEAASRRMGYLRQMSEGRGWWGRMLMYAWIAGLMVVAVLVVFVMPKLRF